MDRDQFFTFSINKIMRVHQMKLAVGRFKVNNTINYIGLYVHGILCLKTVWMEVHMDLRRDCTRPWQRDPVKVTG